MNILFNLCAILLWISAYNPIQEQAKCLGVVPGARSKDAPTVYVTFERMAESNQQQVRIAESADVQNRSAKEQSGEIGNVFPYVLLRIHNNTNWAVKLPTESLYLSPKFVSPLKICDGRGVMGLREGIEIEALYKVELVNGTPATTQTFLTDVSSSAWLPPGQSALFRVPRQSLTKNSTIYLLFNYEWEGNGNEPQHRVYFYWHQLPKKLS